MTDIFISYAHQDAKRAERIAGLLEGHGLSVWWDREIPPGKTWDQVIGTALDEAKCVVVLWSLDSVKSDWVKEEASRGAKRGVLVPVIYDHVDSPLGFGRIEAAQFSDCEDDDSHPEVKGFVAAVKVLVCGADAPEAKEPSPAKARIPKGMPGATSGIPRLKMALVFGLFLIVGLAGAFWWLSQDGAQELEVQIWSVEGDRKHAMIASRSFVQQSRKTLEKDLLADVQRWVLDVVAPGEVPNKPRVKVSLSVPANLESERIQLNTDTAIALRTHLYVVRDEGKVRVVSDLNPESLALLKEDFVIEIGAVGYSSVPVEVKRGEPIQKTIELSASARHVKLAVENFAGDENTVGPRLAHVLAQNSRLSLLGPNSLDRLREEIAEIRRNIGTNPAVQLPVRDSLGVDYIISGIYHQR
ncbi:MAG: toll/interleukin-1 receptor domain-containing protein [Desulfobacteraceae bacterium]|jgi:hypothetical protein